MTKKDHIRLYDELKPVLYTRGHNMANLTEAQRVFVAALEQAAFGADFLKVYAETVDAAPDIKLRNLHAFCLGFGLGVSGQLTRMESNNTSH